MHQFGFMKSDISSEKSKEALIRTVADKLIETKKQDGRILLVLGPAIVHTNSAKYIVQLIKMGFAFNSYR